MQRWEVREQLECFTRDRSNLTLILSLTTLYTCGDSRIDEKVIITSLYESDQQIQLV